MKALHYVCYILLWIGGLNWGLVGLFHYNLVDSLFGVDSTLSSLIYIVVGLATLYTIYAHTMTKECRVCKPR